MADTTFSSRRGAVFVQPNGPNSRPQVLRCLDSDTLTSPKRSKELIKCWNAYGDGWNDVGKTYSPPGPATVTLTELTSTTLSALEKLYCPVTLLFAQVKNGKVTQINNAERVVIMKNAEPTEDSYENLVSRDDDSPSMHGVPFSGDSNVVVVGKPVVQRLTTAETESLNDIHGNKSAICDDKVNPGDYLIAVADADTGVAANVIYTRDGGITWMTAADEPFGVDIDLVAFQWFELNSETERWLVAGEAPAGGQGQVAFSDDHGSNWVAVNVGGSTAGHGAVLGGALHVVDAQEIWLASAAGFIYKSEDSGESWVAMEQGNITTDAYTHIHFRGSRGVAVSESGVVALTQDGGNTWFAGTPVTGTPDLLCCWLPESDTIWAGDDAGELWFSHDFGLSWTQRTGLIGVPNAINDIEFSDSQVGLLAIDNADPEGSIHQTILGGYTYRQANTPGNSGINALHVVNSNMAFAVGAEDGGTGFIAKISA